MLTSIFRKIPAPSRSLRIKPVMVRVVLLGTVVYGLGRSMVGGLDHLGTELRGTVPHADRSMERTHTGADYRQIFDWVKQRRQQDPSPTLWRAAILWRTVWRHAAWTEGMNTGVPVVDPNQVPSNYLNIRPREISARGFNDWNIKYAITDYAGPPFPGSSERFAAGRFHVWEVDGYDDHYVIAPPGVTVSDLRLEGESIRFTVAGAPPGGAELQLRTAAYPRWRARQGDAWLPVGARLPRPDAKEKQEQVVVRAGNGPLILTCDGTLPRYWLGLFVTLCALALLPLAGSAQRRARLERLVERALGAARQQVLALRQRWKRRQLRLAAALAVLVLLLVGVGVTLRGARRIFLPAIEGLGDFSVRWRAGAGRTAACLPVPWNGQFLCGADGAVVDEWLGTASAADDSGEGPALWPGIRVAIHDPGGAVVLRFGRVRLDAPSGLWLQSSGWGRHHLKIIWGDTLLDDVDFDGESVRQLPLPEGMSGARPLRIEIRAASGGASLVFRGGAGVGPRLPNR
jgi:hypothetical protein